ncbi:MAG: hypothetical protein MZV64_19370 [Ignavibacteriales bacterium]|nr:hypothetical protein [Ignavibacteriales bacterium]
MGFAADYSVKDSDDTAIVYSTLLRFGVEKDLAGLLAFEEKDYFRCFALEAIHPSVPISIYLMLLAGWAETE